jgi:hypothetical protein
MTSVVSALSGFVAKGHQTIRSASPPPLKFRTAGFLQYGFKQAVSRDLRCSCHSYAATVEISPVSGHSVVAEALADGESILYPGPILSKLFVLSALFRGRLFVAYLTPARTALTRTLRDSPLKYCCSRPAIAIASNIRANKRRHPEKKMIVGKANKPMIAKSHRHPGGAVKGNIPTMKTPNKQPKTKNHFA